MDTDTMKYTFISSNQILKESFFENKLLITKQLSKLFYSASQP